MNIKINNVSEPLKVYCAGKVGLDGGYRDLLVSTINRDTKGAESIMHPDRFLSVCKVAGGELIYAGPIVLNYATYQHGYWDESLFNYAHGCVPCEDIHIDVAGDGSVDVRLNEDDRDRLTVRKLRPDISPAQAVARCFAQISSCDAVHCYIDSLDCYGTIAELGYASAIGKPIYLVLSSKLDTRGIFEIKVSDGWHGHSGYGGRDGVISGILSLAEVKVKDANINNLSFVDYLKELLVINTSSSKYLCSWLQSNCDCDANDLIDFIEDMGSRCQLDIFSIDFDSADVGISFETIKRDELWFVKHLPGVQSVLFGNEMTIDSALIYVKSQPKLSPQSISNRL